MKIAFAILLLVFVAGCTGVQDIYQSPPAKETPQATATPLDVKISFVEVPAKAQQNSKIIVKWKVESNQQKDITHSAVHYGSTSVPGDLSADVTPASTAYTDLTGISASAKIPNEFSLPIFTKGSGTIYLRAHVIVDNKNYWTGERSIVVE